MYQKPKPPERYLRAIINFLIIVVVLGALLIAEARINTYDVPDPVLLARLDLNQNGYVNRYDSTKTIVKIELPKSGLKSLEGIELCVILESLYIQDNSVTSLDPLGGLDLLHVNIAGNPIDDIGVLLEMENIEELTLSSGDIPQTQLERLKRSKIDKIILDGKLLE